MTRSDMTETVSRSQSLLLSTQNINLGQEKDDVMLVEPCKPTQEELPVAEDDGSDESPLDEFADDAMQVDNGDQHSFSMNPADRQFS